MQCLEKTAVWIFLFAMLATAALNGANLTRIFGGIWQPESSQGGGQGISNAGRNPIMTFVNLEH